MLTSLLPPTITPALRLCFHRRSMEQQRPLSTVTMAFTVVAFLIFVTARSHVAGLEPPLRPPLPCALAILLLAAPIPQSPSPVIFRPLSVVLIALPHIVVVTNV